MQVNNTNFIVLFLTIITIVTLLHSSYDSKRLLSCQLPNSLHRLTQYHNLLNYIDLLVFVYLFVYIDNNEYDSTIVKLPYPCRV